MHKLVVTYVAYTDACSERRHRTQLYRIDAAYCYIHRKFRDLRVRALGTRVCPAETEGPIEMPVC